MLEDAAHAVGAEYKGRRIGSFPTTSVFSFHPNKNMTTGEGGMVVTEDEAVFEKASLLKFHGMDREAWKRFAKAGSPRYDVAVPGFKYNMMDIQAALGLHQLKRLDGFLAERERLARAYDEALAGCAGLILPQRVAYPVRHAWHLYTPLVDIDRLTIDRDRFMEELKTPQHRDRACTTPPRTSSRTTPRDSAGGRRTSPRRISSRSGSSRCRSSRA